MKGPLGFLILLQVGLLLLGGGGMLLLGFPWGPKDPWVDLGLAGALFLLLFGLEALFGRLFPASFKEAEALHRALGLALRRAGLGPMALLFLALLSALSEEVFFRGFLQSLLSGWVGGWGVLLQALLFALFHPAPRAAWAYPLYTGVAGVLFGLAYALSGSLLPGVLAHFLHNARGFYEIARQA
ncbi:putative protease of the Abi (CAAX) family [Thermus oshimai JL-2]|uniref:Putative protease of the Abi (CAAX) family n=1 Tax=Thermus oshimai JL-2 TaxID=751945 RepID=K7QYW7_THEOS|nr:CPBP family intramembrane glutamic endopeptidase [Thermus oshimai]AFV75930.1 putative protease of the Abi (CAAX) family [Thermus oshimai JL-2]